MSSHHRDSKTDTRGSYPEDDPGYISSRFRPSGAISITEALSKRFVAKPSESTYATLNADDSIQIPLATNYVKTRPRATLVRPSATNVPLASSSIEPIPAPYQHGQSTVPMHTQQISSVFPTIARFTQSSPHRTNRGDSSMLERAPVSELPSPLVPQLPPPVPLRPAQLVSYVPPATPAPTGLYDHVDALRADAAAVGEGAAVVVGRYMLPDAHRPASSASSADVITAAGAAPEPASGASPRPIWATDAPPGSSVLTVAPTHAPPRAGGLFGNLHAFVRKSLAVEQGLPAVNAPAAAAAPAPLTPAQVHAAERAEALAAASAGVSWERAAVATAQKLLLHPRATTASAAGYFLHLDELRGLRLPAALADALASGTLRAEHLHWRVQLSWFDWRSRSFFGRTAVGATVPVFPELHPRAHTALPPLPPDVTTAVSAAVAPATDSASVAPASVALGASGLTGATPTSASLLAAAVEASSAVMPPQGYYYLSPLRDADTLLVVEAVLVVHSVAGARELSLGWTALAPVPPAPGCARGIALEVSSTATTNARAADAVDQDAASAPLPASAVDVCAAEVALPSDEPLHADPTQRRALAAVALARPVNQPTVLSFFQGSPRALMLLPEAGPGAQSFTALVQLGALLPAPGLSLAFRVYQCAALQRLQHLLLPHTLYPAHGHCAVGGLSPLKLLLREGPARDAAAASSASSASVCLVAGTLPAPRLLPALAAALPAATATLRAPIVAVPRALEPRLLTALLYQRASFARQRTRTLVGASAVKGVSALSGLLDSCVPRVSARRLFVGVHNGQRFVHDPVQVPLAASAPAALSSSPFQHYSFDGQLDLFSALPLAFAPLGPPLALVAYLVYELQWLPLTLAHARAAPPSTDAPTSSLVLASLTLPLPRTPIVADARHVRVAADGALLDAHTGHTVVRADGTVPTPQRAQPRTEVSTPSVSSSVSASASFDFLTADGVLLPANTADGFSPLSAPMHRSTGATLVGLPRLGFSSAAELVHPRAHKTIWMHAQLRAPAAYAPLLERDPGADGVNAGVAADGAVTLVVAAADVSELRGVDSSTEAAIVPGADTSSAQLPVSLSTQPVRVRVQRRRGTVAPTPAVAEGEGAAAVQAVRRRRRPAGSAAPEEAASSTTGSPPPESATTLMSSSVPAEVVAPADVPAPPSAAPARGLAFPATSSLAALRGRAQLDFSAAAVTKPFSLRRGASSYFEALLENPFAHDLVALVTVHDPQYSVRSHALALRRGDAARSFEPEVSVAADLAAARSYRNQADPAAYAAHIGPRSLTAPPATRPPLALPRALNGPGADTAGATVPAVVQRADDHTRCYLLMLAEAQTVAIPFIFHAHTAPPAPLTFTAPTPTYAVPGWAAARVVTITVSTLRGEPIAQLRLDVQEPLRAE